jgi:hypothetical protein
MEKKMGSCEILFFIFILSHLGTSACVRVSGYVFIVARELQLIFSAKKSPKFYSREKKKLLTRSTHLLHSADDVEVAVLCLVIFRHIFSVIFRHLPRHVGEQRRHFDIQRQVRRHLPKK